MPGLADSAVRIYEKHLETRYTPTAEIQEAAEHIENRFIRPALGEGVMTFIADEPLHVLAIIPDYDEYRILRMYPYSTNMVAADVSFKLSKKQEASVRAGLYKSMLDLPDTLDMDPFTQDDIDAMMECRASGFAYAQTYQPDGVSEYPQIPPFGDDWRANRVLDDNGKFYIGKDGCQVQTWRKIFTHVGKQQVRDGNRFKFALDMVSQLRKSVSILDNLHLRECHPEWDYARTEGEDSDPPPGYYWQENITVFDYHPHAMPPANVQVWRRPKIRKIDDVAGIWTQPQTSVMLLDPEGFGKMFGPVLPKGMAGVDFSDGPIAGIGWFGSLTFQIRNRDGSLCEEQLWTKGMHIPIRKDMMMQALSAFKAE